MASTETPAAEDQHWAYQAARGALGGGSILPYYSPGLHMCVAQFEGQALGGIHGLGLFLGGDCERTGASKVATSTSTSQVDRKCISSVTEEQAGQRVPTRQSNHPAHCACPGGRHLGDGKHRCCIGPSAPRSGLMAPLGHQLPQSPGNRPDTTNNGNGCSGIAK